MKPYIAHIIFVEHTNAINNIAVAMRNLHAQIVKKVQVGKDQEKAQSEKDSHSKTKVGKNQTNNQVLMP